MTGKFNLNKAIKDLKEYSGDYGEPEPGKPRKALLHEDLIKNVINFMKEYYGDRPCAEDPDNCGVFVIQAIPADHLPEIEIEGQEDAELPPLAGHEPMTVMFGKDPIELAVAIGKLVSSYLQMFKDPKQALKLIDIFAEATVANEAGDEKVVDEYMGKAHAIIKELEVDETKFKKMGNLRSEE